MTTKNCFPFSLIANTEWKHLHSSPAINGQALENQDTELEEEDEEKQEEIEGTVSPATHTLHSALYM